MALETEDKAKIIEEHRVNENDTGSPEVQVAILTRRIQDLTSIWANTSTTSTRGAG